MNTSHLKIFIDVYETMNISASARNLHMTQPAVTRCIHSLEEEYGILLFERMNHHLFRTPAANQFYDDAIHLIDSENKLKEDMHYSSQQSLLKVGSTITIGTYYLPYIIASFCQEHPSSKIEASISNSQSLQKLLITNQIDLALVEERITGENLETTLLRKDCLCVIMPKQHPLSKKRRVSIKDIVQYPLLLREKGSAARAFLDHVFAIHDLDVHPQWESSSTHAIINAVNQGVGISILPYEFAMEAIRNHKIVQCTLVDESFQRNNYLVYHKQKTFDKDAQLFIQKCQDQLRQSSVQK